MDLEKTERDRILWTMRNSSYSEEEKLRIVDNVMKIAVPLRRSWVRHAAKRQHWPPAQDN